MIGKTLGSCEIIEKLGQGGMGEVWRARDTRLGREVAIKVLPAEFAGDPERMARFDREARTLASLHHPHIASLFGFEESDGVHYLVMELVEGEELADRIERGPMDPDEAGEIARQIALGLEEAHAKGITHRDLKPANVRITPDGMVKILDFGLARAAGPEEVSGDPATSPTITAAMTQQGVILGTAAYMSPEQARGKTVDARADIWAFGVILWEMLHGQRLFEGETMSDTLAGVLRHEIGFSDLPSGTTAGMRRVLERCLQRDPKQRLHAIADARIELEDTSTAPEPGVAAGNDRTSPLPWVLVAVLVVVAGVLMLRGGGAPEGERAQRSLSILVPEKSPIMLGDWPSMAVAPDGSAIVVTAAVEGISTIFIRDLDSREYRVLTREADALGPFFSPDGQWVGFFQSGRIRKVSVLGGSPVDIAAMSHPRGMSWGEDDYIYFAPSYATGIHRAPAHGNGITEALTEIDSTSAVRTHRWPDALPEGRGFVFTLEGTDSPGDYEDADIMLWDAGSKQVRSLGINGAMARYSPTGHLLVARRGTIYAHPFDLDAGAVTGGPTPVHDGIAGDPASGLYSFDLTRSGDLFYLQAREGDARRTLAWVDRQGRSERLPLPPGPYRYPVLGPRDERVALVMGEGHGGNDDVYLLDLGTRALTRFTFSGSSIMPKWDPAGESVLYLDVQAENNIMRRAADGSRPPELAVVRTELDVLSSLSADGARMFYTRIGGTKLGAITTSEVGPEAAIEVVIDTPAAEWAPKISPDGRWLAYVSDETGREEIYVQPWPLTGAKWQVSHGGGRAPLWSRDGTELFFCRYDELYGAKVSTGSGFSVTTPELVFTHPMDNSGIPMSNYDISLDGSRFLIVEPDQSRVSTAVHVEAGWSAVLDPVE